MSHADFEVKYKPWNSKWIVLRKTSSGNYSEVSEHRKKSRAKEKAKRLAKRAGKTVSFYTMSELNDRRTYTKDYGE